MKYADIKYTVWERTFFDEEVSNESIIQQLKDRDIIDIVDCEILFETLDSLSIEENKGEATIEFYDENDELIWSNNEVD